jgi:hypothetical protein
VHYYAAKGNNRARPPWPLPWGLGVASRGSTVWPHFTVGLRVLVLVQVLPPRGAEPLVCVLLSKTKPLPVTPIRLPLQSIF